jgi:hypothetical protein
MTSRSLVCRLIALCALVILATTSCQKEQTSPPATGSAASATPASAAPSTATAAATAPATTAPPPSTASAAAAAPAAVIASAQYSGDPDLRCDLLEAKRISGGAVVVKWRVISTAGGAQAGLVAAQPKKIRYDFGWDEIYYIDPAENKKYNFLTDAEGKRILEVFWGELGPGEQRLNWAKFPAPPATSKKISVSIPKFAPFEDVPLAE